MVKKKLLLCWWYDRADLIAPFLELQHTFEITVLFYRFPEQEELKVAFPFKRLFWTHYSSPYQILNEVKPDAVCFMGIENLLTFALLFASRYCKIPTAYIAHGITISYESFLQAERTALPDVKPERYRVDNPVYHKNKLHSLTFLLRSLRPKHFGCVPFLLRFIKNTRRYSNISERLYHAFSLCRLADQYIVYSRRFGRMLAERDRIPQERFIPIGPYAMDDLFRVLGEPAVADVSENEQPYYLLIDQPIAQITQEQKGEFYQKLADAAARTNHQLIIKLHPMDYDKEKLPTCSNIRYIRQTDDLPGLIQKADGCYGYYSALLLPVLYFKKCILFLTGNDELVSEWAEMGLVKALPLLEFSPEEADHRTFKVPDEVRQQYLEEYIVAADGKGLERLQAALSNLIIKAHVHR